MRNPIDAISWSACSTFDVQVRSFRHKGKDSDAQKAQLEDDVRQHESVLAEQEKHAVSDQKETQHILAWMVVPKWDVRKPICASKPEGRQETEPASQKRVVSIKERDWQQWNQNCFLMNWDRSETKVSLEGNKPHRSICLPWKENRKNASDEFTSARINRSLDGFRRMRSMMDGRKPINVANVLQESPKAAK